MCEKAPATGADLVFLDLEDACAPSAKESARAIAVGALTGLDWGRTVRAVRINGIDTPWCHGDIIEIVTGARDCVDVLIVPKVRSARDVWWVDVLLGQLETKLGLSKRIGLEVLIEDAEGLARALEIAQASDRLEALIFGAGDLSASLHARVDGNFDPVVDYPGDFWHYARAQVLTAARAGLVDAIDAPYPDYGDPDGYRRSATAASALGFDGKWAIHPSQVPIANEVFSPTPAEVAEATAAIAAYREAEASGVGAIGRDGRLVDAAHMRLAANTLHKAEIGRGPKGPIRAPDLPRRSAERSAETPFSSRREPCYPQARHRTPRREDPPHGTLAQATGGELDRALPARHRAHLLRGLHLPRVLRARARGRFQARLAERRPGRAAAPQGELLHEGARGGPHFGGDRARHRRRGASVLQRLPAPRQQAGVERLPERRRRAASAASSSASTTAGATTSTARAPSSSRSRSSSTSTRPTTAWCRCTARCGPVSSSSTWPSSPNRAWSTSSDRGDQARELPIRPVDRAVVLPRHRERELEALHGRLPGVLPRTGSAREADATRLVDRGAAGRLRGAGVQDCRSASPREHGRHPPVEPA